MYYTHLKIFNIQSNLFAENYIKEKMPKLTAVRSNASYLLRVDISAYSNDSRAFTRDLRKKTGLYISAGASYGTGGEGFVRINLATQRARILDGLSRLEGYISSLDKS